MVLKVSSFFFVRRCFVSESFSGDPCGTNRCIRPIEPHLGSSNCEFSKEIAQMVDETQTEHGEECQTTSQEGQTEFAPELPAVVQPFEQDANNEARTSPPTDTSLESEHNQSLIPTLKRKHAEDSSESAHSGDDFGSASESPNSEESTGLDSESPSLEAAPGSPLRRLDDFVCTLEDQMVFVTSFEWGTNMKLVSDVMASVGVFLTPERRGKTFQCCQALVTGEERVDGLPLKNWITKRVIKEVQQQLVDSTAENCVRRISVIHERRCGKLRTLCPQEEPLMAHVTRNEIRKDTIGARLMNPTEAFTKARKQIVPPSIVLKPYRPTSLFDNSSKGSRTETSQISELLETQRPFQSQQPLHRQVNLFNDFSDAKATGLNGNGCMSCLGIPSADLEQSSGLGQNPEMPELHNTEGLVNNPTAQGDASFNGTSLMQLSSDFSFHEPILHSLEDVSDTLQFQQLQLNDTEYLEQDQEPKSDHFLGQSVKGTRRDLSQETGQSNNPTLRGSRKRMKRGL